MGNCFHWLKGYADPRGKGESEPAYFAFYFYSYPIHFAVNAHSAQRFCGGLHRLEPLGGQPRGGPLSFLFCLLFCFGALAMVNAYFEALCDVLAVTHVFADAILKYSGSWAVTWGSLGCSSTRLWALARLLRWRTFGLRRYCRWLALSWAGA